MLSKWGGMGGSSGAGGLVGAGWTLTCLPLDSLWGQAQVDGAHVGAQRVCLVILSLVGSPFTVRVVLASGMCYWRWSWPEVQRVS